MPTYDYRCGSCGPFTRLLSMREVGDVAACPGCRSTARRVFGAPALVGGPTPLNRARGAAEKSSSEPAVVRRGPAAPSAGPTPLTGRLAGLPRP
jgi:putative FmdB family regulatory protein